MDRSLSVILAVRNVECTLRSTVLDMIDLMSELTDRFELIIVDDASTDATIEVADELAAVYPQLLALRHDAPRGYWSSVQSGLERSLGEWILVAEEDQAAPWNHVGRLWTLLEDYDLIAGRPLDAQVATSARSTSAQGGYLLGRRRLFLAALQSLGDWPAFTARLSQLGARWREVAIPVSRWHRWSFLGDTRSTAAGALTAVAPLLRPDGSEKGPGKPIFSEIASKKTRSVIEPFAL